MIGILGIAVLVPSLLVHAETAMDCLPPVPPTPVTDQGTLAEYREEIGEEYSDYFDEAQPYLRCLDAARASAVFIARITPWAVEPPLQIWNCPIHAAARREAPMEKLIDVALGPAAPEPLPLWTDGGSFPEAHRGSGGRRHLRSGL